jgi:Holliday junction resolvase
MKDLKYNIVALDADNNKIDTKKIEIPTPFKIIRHRPDVIGVNNKNICIGEAKTKTDLSNSRTKEQIKDWVDLTKNKKIKCKLIIAIPQSAEESLNKIFFELNIMKNKNISCLTIPEVLFPHEIPI